MAKNHVQPGNIIAVTLGATFASGDLIKVGDRAGVCLLDGGSGDEISVAVDEVFNVSKLSTDVMSTIGTTVYLDETNKRVTLTDEGAGSTVNIVAGYTTSVAGNGDLTVNVKLNG